MSKKLSIFSLLEIAFPVVCETDGCQKCNKNINMIFLAMNEEDDLFENYGDEGASEDDICRHCESLGVLQSPLPYVFYSEYKNGCDYFLAIKMNLDTIESLTRVLKNFQEDSTVNEEVFLASDAMCNCFDDFHVFRIGEEGDFVGDDWDFNVHPFEERNKVVIVSESGVRLSCDISTKGDNEEDLCTVRTCFFDLNQLAELNTWITKRVGIERE